MSYIPAIRLSDLRGAFEKNFNRRVRSSLVDSPKIKDITKIKDMVLIDFRHAPYFKLFRWNKEWWEKTSWKSGTNEESFHVLEFDSNQKVGVRLQDLCVEKRKWIHKKACNLS